MERNNNQTIDYKKLNSVKNFFYGINSFTSNIKISILSTVLHTLITIQ